MSIEEFLMDNPWAAEVAKSSLLLALIRYLKRPRTVEEISQTFTGLNDDDIAKALYVLKEIGAVDGDGERAWLSDVGRRFLKAYDETF